MLETAVVLPLFLVLVLGTVDLGFGVFRHHVLAQTSRQIARAAIVHGSLADRLHPWGPEPITAVASDPGPVPELAARSLVGWELSQVAIHVEWIDGTNHAEKGHRVRVELSAPYVPMMTFILGSPSVTLRAVSNMRIAH